MSKFLNWVVWSVKSFAMTVHVISILTYKFWNYPNNQLYIFSDSFYNAHCLSCHLTVHTKYSSTETDPRFDPTVNLLCPERILIISNGFMHMLRIDVDTPVVPNSNSLPQQNFNLPCTQQTLFLPRTPLPNEEDRCSVPFTGSEADSEHSVVARIIADFSDIETDHTQRSNNAISNNNNETQQRTNTEQNSSVSYEKLIFSSNCVNTLSTSSMTLLETSLPVVMQNAVGSNDSNQSRKRNQRIVTKSYRNGITTIDMQVRWRKYECCNLNIINYYIINSTHRLQVQWRINQMHTNSPKIMKSVKRFPHFANAVWLTKSTNSQRITLKISYRSLRYVQLDEQRLVHRLPVQPLNVVCIDFRQQPIIFTTLPVLHPHPLRTLHSLPIHRHRRCIWDFVRRLLARI